MLASLLGGGAAVSMVVPLRDKRDRGSVMLGPYGWFPLPFEKALQMQLTSYGQLVAPGHLRPA